MYLNRALNSADVIILLGARLNWILHFGLEPRFRKDVKIIQVCLQQYVCMSTIYCMTSNNWQERKEMDWFGFVCFCIVLVYLAGFYLA